MEEVHDWEALADWLEINSANITPDCESTRRAKCIRRNLVNIYREKLGTDDKCKVVSKIADALENMEQRRSAQILRELYGEL